MPSAVRVACALCVGAAPEPFLEACLASIADAVDLLVVNDNSGQARSANVAVLEASAFAERGALRIERHPFVDFADMRNRAFAPLRDSAYPPDWLLWLDADEVHGEQVRYLARDVVPRLAPDVAHLDAYTYHFSATFSWISDIARRFSFYRFSRELHWVNAVHEKVEGLHGRAVVVPYIYHHYGNVATPRALAQKHQRYYELGNPVPRPPDPDEATAAVYLERAHRLRRFTGTHPAFARPVLERIERERGAELAALDAALVARRTPSDRFAAALRAANESLRVQLRRVERPGLYRAPTVAR